MLITKLPPQIYHAIPNANPKKELERLYLDADNGYIVGTDTSRIAFMKTTVCEWGKRNVLIPKSAIGSGKPLQIGADLLEGMVVVNGSLVEALKGGYPNWLKAVPKTYRYKVTLNGASLKKEIKKRLLASGISEGAISLDFRPDGRVAVVNLENKRTFASINYEGDKNIGRISIRLKYLLEAMYSKETTMKFNKYSSPFAVVEGEVTTVIMPIIEDDRKLIGEDCGEFRQKEETVKILKTLDKLSAKASKETVLELIGILEEEK